MVDPAELVWGLKAVAEKRDVKIFEYTLRDEVRTMRKTCFEARTLYGTCVTSTGRPLKVAFSGVIGTSSSRVMSRMRASTPTRWGTKVYLNMKQLEETRVVGKDKKGCRS